MSRAKNQKTNICSRLDNVKYLQLFEIGDALLAQKRVLSITT